MLRLLLIALTLACLLTTAHADDDASSFVTRLFMNVCVPNVGHDHKGRAWAQEKKLIEVTSPSVLKVFVGLGDGGIAWAVPAYSGSFALSIPGTSHACAVYARLAIPFEIETNFKKLLEGAARLGLEVKVVSDTTHAGSTGMVHTLIYSVSSVNNPNCGNLYTMQTAERTGGAF